MFQQPIPLQSDEYINAQAGILGAVIYERFSLKQSSAIALKECQKLIPGLIRSDDLPCSCSLTLAVYLDVTPESGKAPFTEKRVALPINLPPYISPTAAAGFLQSLFDSSLIPVNSYPGLKARCVIEGDVKPELFSKTPWSLYNESRSLFSSLEKIQRYRYPQRDTTAIHVSPIEDELKNAWTAYLHLHDKKPDISGDSKGMNISSLGAVLTIMGRPFYVDVASIGESPPGTSLSVLRDFGIFIREQTGLPVTGYAAWPLAKAILKDEVSIPTKIGSAAEFLHDVGRKIHLLNLMALNPQDATWGEVQSTYKKWVVGVYHQYSQHGNDSEYSEFAKKCLLLYEFFSKEPGNKRVVTSDEIKMYHKKSTTSKPLFSRRERILSTYDSVLSEFKGNFASTIFHPTFRSLHILPALNSFLAHCVVNEDHCTQVYKDCSKAIDAWMVRSISCVGEYENILLACKRFQIPLSTKRAIGIRALSAGLLGKWDANRQHYKQIDHDLCELAEHLRPFSASESIALRFLHGIYRIHHLVNLRFGESTNSARALGFLDPKKGKQQFVSRS